MPFLLLKLLGFGRMLKNALGAVLSAIMRYPVHAAAIALALACIWLWRGWSGEQTDHARTRQAHKAQIEQIEAASQANLAAALAQVKIVEAKSAQLAKDNANEERALRAELGARAAANAERMRFDKVCRSTAAPAPADNPAPVDPGPGPDAVVLERRDYDTLIDNTVRLKAAHAWGQDMLRDGLAKVPVDWPEPAF